MTFSYRHRRTLAAFEEAEPLRYCDLPPGIGRGTIRDLVAAGYLEVAAVGNGPYSKDRAWRRTPQWQTA